MMMNAHTMNSMPDAISKAPPEEMVNIATDQWTQPFWDAAKQHKLVGAKCGNCGKFRLPPSPMCPKCHSQQIDWVHLSGEGTIYTYTIITRAMSPAVEPHIPYVPAVISLEGAGDTRLVSNIVGARVGDIAIGRKVRVIWEDHKNGTTVPHFELVPD
jgi:uncharacterized protein